MTIVLYRVSAVCPQLALDSAIEISKDYIFLVYNMIDPSDTDQYHCETFC